VGEEASAPYPTGLMVLLATVCESLSHFMEGPLVAPFLVPAVEGFHGVVAVVESSAVGADSVVGSG